MLLSSYPFHHSPMNAPDLVSLRATSLLDGNSIAQREYIYLIHSLPQSRFDQSWLADDPHQREVESAHSSHHVVPLKMWPLAQDSLLLWTVAIVRFVEMKMYRSTF